MVGIPGEAACRNPKFGMIALAVPKVESIAASVNEAERLNVAGLTCSIRIQPRQTLSLQSLQQTLFCSRVPLLIHRAQTQRRAQAQQRI
jgi:hypothetical protein